MAPGHALRTRPVALVVVLFAATLVAVSTPVQAGLSFDSGDIELGKVLPGYTGQHSWNVTNTGTDPVDVEVQVQCGCPIYVIATPDRFTFDPGATERVDLSIDVALGADPGIHDYTVRFVERTATGTGGSAQGAIARNVQFQVESAKVYVDGRANDGTIAAKFVSGYQEEVAVDVSASLTYEGKTTSLGDQEVVGRGSVNGSAVTRFSVDPGLSAASPAGRYTLTLSATWSNAETGRSGSQDGITFTFTHGEVVRVIEFDTELRSRSVAFLADIENLGTEARTVWLEVELTEDDSPDPIVLSSDRQQMAAGSTASFEIEWTEATGTAYAIRAYAVTPTSEDDEAGARSPNAVESSIDVPAGKHRSPSAAAVSTAEGKEDELPGAGGSKFLSGNVKLVIGIVVGAVLAVTATLVITKKRD